MKVRSTSRDGSRSASAGISRVLPCEIGEDRACHSIAVASIGGPYLLALIRDTYNRMTILDALILSLPTRNSTVRMRAWRALKDVGCGVLRDGVYVLPASQRQAPPSRKSDPTSAPAAVLP